MQVSVIKYHKMKKLIILALIAITSTGIEAQNKNAKASFEVDGVCMMCKMRIEKAAITTKGVKSAVWNLDNHILSIMYNDEKTDVETVQKNIAAVGHDTGEIIATDEAYNSVDDCCRYRDPKVVEDHQKN